ncbi:Histidine phosphatase superfamily [Phytophthora cactorum]|nr:Histidine phosphatase superfamily [Phytophthora cactorum]
MLHLTELGYEQAVAAGKSIKKIIGNETMRFIVSPYVRTIETFCGILKAWGFEGKSIPWSEEPRIREQDFGNFQEPMKIRECKAQRRRFGSFFYRFPSGESPADVYDTRIELPRVAVPHVREIIRGELRLGDTRRGHPCDPHALLQVPHQRVRVAPELPQRRVRRARVQECQGKFMLKTIVSNHVQIHEDGSVSVETDETHSCVFIRANHVVHTETLLDFSDQPFRHPPPPWPPTSSTMSSPRHGNSEMFLSSPSRPVRPNPSITPRPCVHRRSPSTNPRSVVCNPKPIRLFATYERCCQRWELVPLPAALKMYLLQLMLVGVVSYVAVVLLIPVVGRRMPAKLSGKDLCKRGTPAGDIPIPEALGIVSGLLYVAALVVTVLTVVDNSDVKRMMAWGIVSILSMIVLGFTDDLSDLRWRHNLTTVAYQLRRTHGCCAAKPVRFLFEKDTLLYTVLNPVVPLSDGGEIAELGLFYYLYMGMMAVFCTNAIKSTPSAECVADPARPDNEHFHYLSLMFMVPYLATTLGLLKHNWYPSRVFVGDTFCYYAGMTFAQDAAALLSAAGPQLPVLASSALQDRALPASPTAQVQREDGSTEPSTITPESTRSNYTIINLFLVVFGPMKENHLVLALLAFQVLCCGLAFYIRYGISGYFYDFVQ